MATTKLAYAAAAQLTITLNSLANNTTRQSAVLDNTSNLYTDILIGGGFKTSSGSLGTNPGLSIWAAVAEAMPIEVNTPAELAIARAHAEKTR